MDLQALGTLGIVISVIATSAFVIGYLFLAPWYRSAIGISLVASKSWLAGISWLAALNYLFGVDTSSPLYLALRAALWVALPFVSVATLYALLIRGQVRVRSERRRTSERTSGEGAQ